MDPKLYKLKDWIDPNKLEWDILLNLNYHPCLLEHECLKNKEKKFNFLIEFDNLFLLKDYIKFLLEKDIIITNEDFIITNNYDNDTYLLNKYSKVLLNEKMIIIRHYIIMRLSESPLINDIWNNIEIKNKYPDLITILILNEYLLQNKYAIDLIKRNLHIIQDWSGINIHCDAYNFMLCSNNRSIELIENIIEIEGINSSKICLSGLARNKNATHLILKYKDLFNKKDLNLSFNLTINNNLDKFIDHFENEINPNVIQKTKYPYKIMKKIFEKINFNPDYLKSDITANKHAIKYLKENPNMINWKKISLNSNSYEIIKDNLNKIDFSNLSLNSDINTINILKDNQNNINYFNFSYNPSIYEINREYLKERINPIKKELMEYIYNPMNLKEKQYFIIK